MLSPEIYHGSDVIITVGYFGEREREGPVWAEVIGLLRASCCICKIYLDAVSVRCRLPLQSSTNSVTTSGTVLNVDAADLCFRTHGYCCWLSQGRITVICWSVVIVVSRRRRPEGQPRVGCAADRNHVRARLQPPYSVDSPVVSHSLPGHLA